jgi:16S rRNA (cytosine1402-N4)-methyltransferase
MMNRQDVSIERTIPMDDQDQKPKRRVRYSGTHPKTYEEKYKELQPEKYADTIAKVIKKGNTPAGQHRPIMVDEILHVLNIHTGETGLDATLGYGGHAEAMLKSLNHTGHLYGIDQDPIELEKTTKRLSDLGYDTNDFSVRNINFGDLDESALDGRKLDFILADLGVSSMQIDNPSRGFTFKFDGPLDLRMNPHQGVPAMYRLHAMSEEEIVLMLRENADEPYAERIAKAIVEERQKGIKIQSTFQLKAIVTRAMPKLPPSEKEEETKKTLQRVFQALRIEVNHEFDVLDRFLNRIPELLESNGRVAILSFHSGEDRLVKKAFLFYHRQGVFKEISPEFERPSMSEQSSNPRARSAKLRWAIKA